MNPPRSAPLRALLVLGLAAFVLTAVNAWFLWKPRADDTLIHLVFARNSAAGRPFEYNVGQPSRALTAPLWNAGLAIAGLVTGTVSDNQAFLTVFRVLAVAVLGVTLFLVWKISRRLGADTVCSGAGLLLLATNPSVFYWTAANPMETPGAALIAVALTGWAAVAAQRSSLLVWGGGGALTVTGFLMRPELMVLGALAGGAAFIWRRPWRGALAFAAVLGAGLAGWSVALRLAGLAVLPNAGSARRLMVLLDDARPFPLLGIPWSPDALLFAALFLPLVLGAVWLLIRGSTTERAGALAGLLMLGFSIAFFAFYFPTTWQGRYLLPALFAVAPAGAAGLARWPIKPSITALAAILWAAAVAAVLLRPLGSYADAPRQRAAAVPEFVAPPAGALTLLCQEIQSAYFYPQLTHICTEGLIGLESLEARKRNLSVLQFLQEQRPDLVGHGRYPLRDPEHVAEAIRQAGEHRQDLALPGLRLVYLGEMAGCGPVFRTEWESSPQPPDR